MLAAAVVVVVMIAMIMIMKRIERDHDTRSGKR